MRSILFLTVLTVTNVWAADPKSNHRHRLQILCDARVENSCSAFGKDFVCRLRMDVATPNLGNCVNRWTGDLADLNESRIGRPCDTRLLPDSCLLSGEKLYCRTLSEGVFNGVCAGAETKYLDVIEDQARQEQRQPVK